MHVTTEMLQAATRKAIEAGLLPRHACQDEMSVNQELIRLVLQAGLDASPVDNLHSLYPPPYQDKPSPERGVDFSDLACALPQYVLR